jgi:hypothetical protein
MTSENIEKVEQIVTPNRTGIFIKCACGTEGIDIAVDPSDEEWSEEKTFYLSFWRYGRDSVHSFSTRLSRAWKVLIGKGYEADEIILNEKEAYQLREFISRHLCDRDLIETLRKDNEALNMALMKYQASSEYDTGYEHGQDSLLRHIKEFFDDVTNQRERKGSSRISVLLEGYLAKIMK